MSLESTVGKSNRHGEEPAPSRAAPDAGNVRAPRVGASRGTVLSAVGRRQFLGLAGAGAVGLAAGCVDPGATITEFSARPTRLCGCTSVTVSWAVGADTARLEVLDPDSGSVRETHDLPASEGEGTTSVTICEDAGLRLVAELEDDTETQRHDDQILVIPPGGRTFRFGTLGTCVDGSPSWRVVKPKRDWPDGVQVGTVTNTSSFGVTVTHRGASFTLPSLGTSTASFTGQVPWGDWSIAPLEIQPEWLETCSDSGSDGAVDDGGGGPDPSDALPPTAIDVEVVCSE